MFVKAVSLVWDSKFCLAVVPVPVNITGNGN